jgi:signal peptidase II
MTAMAGSAARDAARTSGAGRWALFLGLALLVAVADQVSKALVAANFQPVLSLGAPADEPGGPTRVVGDWLRIAITHNDGGIFGLAGSSAPLLALASLLVIGFIVYYQARVGSISHPLVSATLGLLLGGALGNLVDRARLGYVVDWVDTGIGATRWYTFNVADSAISVSIVLLVVIGLFGARLEARGHRGDAAEVADGAGGPGLGEGVED